VHRLVSVLAGRGFLTRDPATAQYRLGLNAFRLGAMFLSQTHVREAALPVIHALARATGETVNLNVVIDRHRVCIEKAESAHDIRHAVELGRPMPLYAGASGKVLLAHLPEPEIEAVLGGRLSRLTGRTVVEPARLRRSLELIRRRGVAETSDERVEGASAVSAPVRDASGRVVAGLTISGPTYRFTPDRVRRYTTLVREGARSISAGLGYDGARGPRVHAR
jgi:DNA-binding IclR family transcriptional regulator